MKPITQAERLINYSVHAPSGCWLWNKAKTDRGYGRISVGNEKQKYAHRVSFETFNGPIPDGMHVLHRCDTRSCVNPNHLFLGTNDDNVADMMQKGRNSYKLTLDETAQIYSACKDGASRAKLAKEYGVSASLIYKIAVGRGRKCPTISS